MKIARILQDGKPLTVAVRGENAYSISRAVGVDDAALELSFYDQISQIAETAGTLTLDQQPIGRFKEMNKLIPVPEVRSIRDFYAFETHVKNARRKRGLDMIPEWYRYPVFYFSNTSNLYPAGSDVPIPAYTKEMDYELEIAIVISRDGRNIPAERAWDHILGITLANDWSARDMQREEMKVGLGPSKGKDFATSIGPVLVTKDEVLSHRNTEGKIDLDMKATVNGIVYSSGNLNSIYWDIEKLIEWASMESWIRAGDVIMTGTVGTGCILESQDHPWLKRGDRVILSSDMIGNLDNTLI
ncbi:MAG: fumarylacetoacetate hydrolase family protein [Candidatus Thermoplasmatota archaeon]|jgi:fumarylacetoacetate (FAA) hydrolase|nr:fumarylacetoacetate hydrolase family protein [Candidatus Thermoplasmatota archaeon]MCL5732893.1 fumarylacetoacetate hydrolase family protein [Candidatus Thermoplasmatota archaeon]